MSTAPLSARPFRFLAVAASTAFIVLMLGTGSHADQTASASSSHAFFAKPHRNNFESQRRIAETYDPACQDCIQQKYNQCINQEPDPNNTDVITQINCTNGARSQCAGNNICSEAEATPISCPPNSIILLGVCSEPGPSR
jgi:hypothetical protein